MILGARTPRPIEGMSCQCLRLLRGSVPRGTERAAAAVLGAVPRCVERTPTDASAGLVGGATAAPGRLGNVCQTGLHTIPAGRSAQGRPFLRCLVQLSFFGVVPAKRLFVHATQSNAPPAGGPGSCGHDGAGGAPGHHRMAIGAQGVGKPALAGAAATRAGGGGDGVARTWAHQRRAGRCLAHGAAARPGAAGSAGAHRPGVRGPAAGRGGRAPIHRRRHPLGAEPADRAQCAGAGPRRCGPGAGAAASAALGRGHPRRCAGHGGRGAPAVAGDQSTGQCRPACLSRAGRRCAGRAPGRSAARIRRSAGFPLRGGLGQGAAVFCGRAPCH